MPGSRSSIRARIAIRPWAAPQTTSAVTQNARSWAAQRRMQRHLDQRQIGGNACVLFRSFPSLGVTLPIGIIPDCHRTSPGRPAASAPWTPSSGVLARRDPAAARAHHAGADARHAAGGCAPGTGARGGGPGWPGSASRREGSGRVWHGWSCPGNIGCVTWRQRGTRAVHLAGGT